MKTRNRILGALLLVFCGRFAQASPAGIPSNDVDYLNKLYADTWRCISHFVNENTGLPYDSHRRTHTTAITNIGFYMASCAVASKTGLIGRQEGLEKTRKALLSLSKAEKWRGFPVTWIDPYTLKTSENKFSTVDHLGNLTASLVLVRQIYPELKQNVDDLMKTMDWGIIYDPGNRLYRGGYRLDKQDFDIQQPWGNWYYGFLGADTRLGSFFGVARGEVPLAHWSVLDRSTETKYGLNYYVPGWQGGGLFMQMVSGVFLDERTTVLGESAANFAYAQIVHSRQKQFPVWGWSAAEAPSGEYLGWGVLKDEIVTPHATALSIVYYPRQALKNLKELEKRGARVAYLENGTAYEFGFRDSLNWQTGQVSSGYLVLDQAMLFLSLANLLYDGTVWQSMGRDPLVQQGETLLPEYGQRDMTLLQKYGQRDENAPNAVVPLLVK